MSKHFVRYGLIMDGIRKTCSETRNGGVVNLFYDYIDNEVLQDQQN